MNILPTACNFEGKTYNARIVRNGKNTVKETSRKLKSIKEKPSGSSRASVKQLSKKYEGISLAEIKKSWNEGMETLADIFKAQF